MVTIKGEQLQKLVKHKILFNTHKGYVSKTGNPVGVKKTTHKYYIEDYYADLARSL